VARVTLSIALTKRPWALVTLAAIATADSFERGLELIRDGEFFAAHEELEDAWRAAEPAERDFLQGLVHVAVAWYQAGRGNRVGCERQLEKARRRLGPYAPAHRGVDISALLEQLERAAGTVAAGSLELSRPQL
jgi:predicted metal-dependent hydrolase